MASSREEEVTVSQDRAISLQPGQQSETPSQKNRKEKSKFQKEKRAGRGGSSL